MARLQPDEPVRLQVSRDKITRLPPADIASILNDLDRRASEALDTAFSDETLADTLEESPSDVQVAVLSRLSPGCSADILEEMGPDEAADLLAASVLPLSTTYAICEAFGWERGLDRCT